MAERAPATASGDGAAPTGLARLLTPRVVLPLLALVLIATVVFTPATDRPGDSRLTTRSTEPQGAQGLFEIARRIGWRPERRDVGLTAAQARLAAPSPTHAPRVSSSADTELDTTATYAVLDPPNDLTAAEAGALLDAVRRGAGLLVVLREGAMLGDSLRVQPSQTGAAQAGEARAGECTDTSSATGGGLINWPTGHIHSYWLVPRAPLPSDTVTFASVALSRAQLRARRRAAEERARVAAAQRAKRDSVGRTGAQPDSARADTTAGDEDEEDAADSAATAVEDSVTLHAPVADTAAVARLDSVQHEPAALGFPLGAGRVVVVADPDWLRNDVLRVCRWNAGIAAVRMLEYLGRGRTGGRLVFDEFHQGFGRHPSTLRVIRRALTATAAGRALTQALIAALVLLAALGARALPPRSTARLERRSPLEHVGALSRAYAQVGATRLATRRLVRGVRRRHGSGAAPRFVRAASGSGEGDEEFLAAVAARYPAAASDAALVREALRSPRTPAQFLEVGRALERLEDAIAGRVPPAPSR